MTVPEGAPLPLQWADRMAQALQIAGSYRGIATHIFETGSSAGLDALENLQGALNTLDDIRHEILESTKGHRWLRPATPEECQTRNDLYSDGKGGAYVEEEVRRC